MELEKNIIHQPPLYYGYLGGYDSITQCINCNATGLYEDCHPANPCHWCGGKVEEIGSGKWRKPIKRFNWTKFRFITLQKGYWDIKRFL